MSAVIEIIEVAIAGTTYWSPVLGLLPFWLLSVFVKVTDKTPSRFRSSTVSSPFLRRCKTDFPLRLTAVTRYPCCGDSVTVKGWCRLTVTVPVWERRSPPTTTVPFPVISMRRDTVPGTSADNSVIRAYARIGIQHSNMQRRGSTAKSFRMFLYFMGHSGFYSTTTSEVKVMVLL